jgi:hypothetical protein
VPRRAKLADNAQVAPRKAKSPTFTGRASLVISLTMSYFHTGIRTIIGAEAFHFPVRDGKEWDHLAMVIRLDLSPARNSGKPIHRIESV